MIGSMREASEAVTDSKVADVKSLFDTHVNEGKVIVVVEGDDDAVVYKKVMNAEAVCFYPDCDCDKHAVILDALNGRYGNRLIAIKDADFDRLEGITYPYPNLMLTDTHDLESMIVTDCLPELQGDDAARCAGVTITPIYGELEDISYLKWYNHSNHTCLIFKGIIPDMDFAAYFNTVVAKTSTKRAVTVTLADIESFKASNTGADEKQITNGHDIFERVYVQAKPTNGANFPKKPFFQRLRRAYPGDKFVNTALYQAIKSWEISNGVSILAVVQHPNVP